MFEKSDLEELYNLLRKANVTDKHISRGVRLTTQGEKKIAERFKIPLDTVPDMLLALTKQIGAFAEDSPRFTYEKDYLGNLTIRDSKTGKSRFIQGDSAFALDDELSAHPDKEQEIIGKQFGIEILNEGEDEEAIVSDKGSFNFPFRGKFATAVFGLDASGKFRHEVVSLRDEQDNEVELTDSEKDELNQVALRWIDKV